MELSCGRDCQKGKFYTRICEKNLVRLLRGNKTAVYVSLVRPHLEYHKVPKISPGVYIFQRPFLRVYFWWGLSTEGNLRFKTDWVSLIVGNKFTVFALFYFVLESNFPSTSPRGAYIWRGDLTEGFLRYRFEGLIFGGTI